jgi:hypothetical protein
MDDRNNEDAPVSDTPRVIKAGPTPKVRPEITDRLAEIDRLQGLRDAAKVAETKTVPMKYVDCRTFGHSWQDINVDRHPEFGWMMQLTCDRCGTTRNDVVDRYGVVDHRKYAYPSGYRDPDKWARSAWRIQFIRRLDGS